MKIIDIIKQIGNFGVPIFTLDKHEITDKYCFSIIIPTDELNKIRKVHKTNATPKDTGAYYYNCSCQEFYNYSNSKTPEAVSQIIDLIKKSFDIDDDKELAFSLFTILHEIGHIHHFLNSKMTYLEYWNEYYREWEKLVKMYRIEYFFSFSDEDKRNTNLRYGELYRNTALEKVADDFAIKHFKENYQQLKHNNTME